MIRPIFILMELVKFRVSLFAALSASAGFVLARQEISKEILLPTLGVFLLASGSCALNQYQERRLDGLMERTRGRPLPSGKLSGRLALWIAFSLICSGSLILLWGAGWTSCALGLFALLWYNGVYTSLKKITAFAAVPGALVGTIPPALGWASGGGGLLDPRIGAVMFFFFIWQVPHFWLRLIDVGGDYERAGLPSLTRIFSNEQLRGILFIWTLSTAVSGLLIPLFHLLNSYFTGLILLVLCLWLTWSAKTILSPHWAGAKGPSFRLVFTKLNIYAFCVISLLSLDRLLKSSYSEFGLVGKALTMIGLFPV